MGKARTAETTIDHRTARALAELGRAAARHAGIPDDVVITMTICQDRERDWCDLCDPNFAQVTEDEFEENKEGQTSPNTSGPCVTRKVWGLP